MKNLKFTELKLSKEVLRAIEKMGFEETMPIQSEAIPPMLEGRDVIAQAPTGTGKTCAFGIPVIENISQEDRSIQVLVLCPTRELVIQTAEELQNVAKFKKDIMILPIYGGQQIERQIIALRKRPQIVVATPGRMMDHLRRRTAKINTLKVVVLDEADEMLNMGFREDIDTILQTVPEEKQMVLFSATLSKDIREIANTYQKDAVMVKIAHKEMTIPTIAQYYLEVKGKNKLELLTRIIDSNRYTLCIVFCNTKKMVDELAETLVRRGYSAEALHGDIKQAQRDKVMSRFRKGAVDILVATDVAARGIDVDDIEAVINYDIPSELEYYVHRIGRTGRANKAGVAYTFVAGREMSKLRDIMYYTKAKIHLFKLPTLIDVEEMRVSQILKNAKEIAEKEKLSVYTNCIEKMIDEDETNDLTTIDFAAAFLKMLIDDNGKKSKS